MLTTGMKAPDFTLKNQHGEEIRLSDFLGRKIVLYFYPKDNTPGCTRQACAFAANYEAFKAKDIVVIGVSKDSVASHVKFAEKYELPFILLSDPELLAIEPYGVWHPITQILIQCLRDSFLYFRTKTAENRGQMRQIRVKSRILLAEYDEMTGLGLLPAGLFSFQEERCFACDAELQSEMHPLWTITLKRPGLRGIVQSIILFRCLRFRDIILVRDQMIAQMLREASIMPSVVNKRGLLCNENRALFLLEYKHEMSLLKKLILIAEKGISGMLPKDTWCYEGICHLFARSIVSHARMAYDNMLLGHFDAANMVLRAMIENSACFEVIYLYEEEELWKYYLVQSYRDTIISPAHGLNERDKRFLDDMYQRYDIGADFLEKGDKKKAYIDMPYGWTFKINKNFNAKGLCSLLEHGDGEYYGFQLMSPYSHGTSLRNILSDSSSMDQIMSMLASIYISLFRLVYLYCMETIDESFDPITEELENIFHDYFETNPWNNSDERDE